MYHTSVYFTLSTFEISVALIIFWHFKKRFGNEKKRGIAKPRNELFEFCNWCASQSKRALFYPILSENKFFLLYSLSRRVSLIKSLSHISLEVPVLHGQLQSTQCVEIGRFLIVLGDMVSIKSSPNAWWNFWPMWKATLSILNYCGYFLGNFWNHFRSLFILASGHPESTRERMRFHQKWRP